MRYLLIPQFAPLAKHVSVVAGIADKLALKERHVEAGGVVVYKLEEEHLHCQLVLILQVGLGDFYKTQNSEKDKSATTLLLRN